MHRRLVLVLGDQLDPAAPVLDGLDPDRDRVLMAEAREEATHVPAHKKRLVAFFAGMRHFAADLRARGGAVIYHALDGPDPVDSLAAAVMRHPAAEVHVTQPGDWRVLAALRDAVPGLTVHPDRHFLSDPDAFARFAEGRRRVVLEDFYRMMRKRTGWLMEGDAPAGGLWNFDRDNRKSFGRGGPGLTPGRPDTPPDTLTREVMAMVERHFPDAPGSTEGFAEPVTRAAARAHLEDFVAHRLPAFGDYQDAIAAGHPTLWHSRLSVALNLKLLDPREVIAAAVEAWERGRAPLNAVEGFVRQILGWREFVRGVYWTRMPEYGALNALGAEADLPRLYWTGQTEMACLADTLGQVRAHAYSHHIQRLMVWGLFAMLWGAHPRRVNDWHLAMHMDAVDWVSLPNVLGMGQHADGGIVGTKPYAASGAYISRMSDCCAACPYDPRAATGPRACPFTTLYWEFLDRHRDRFGANRRMGMQMKNLERKEGELPAIRKQAEAVRTRFG